MATLEKPKKEKTKKSTSKKKSQDKYDIAKDKNDLTEDIVQSAESTLELNADSLLNDLEKFVIHENTTSHADIVSHNCSIASVCPEATSPLFEEKQIDEDDEASLSIRQYNNEDFCKQLDSPNVSLHDELMATSALNTETVTKPLEPWTKNFEPPTAPAAPERPTILGAAPPAAVILPSPVSFHYPDLSPMQPVETKSEIVYQRPKISSPGIFTNSSQLKPFTAEQMKEIYSCPDLELVKQFELEFLMNSLLDSYENDPLYISLLDYYNLQNKLTMNIHDIKQYRKEALDTQACIWTEVPITRTFTGRCADKVEVKETVTYNIAQVDGKNLESATVAINKLFDTVCKAFVMNLLTARITKVKIDHIIYETMSYSRISTFASTAVISLNKSLDAETLQCVAHIRRAISILFTFSRKPSPNKNFDADLKSWFTQLISLHLLLATKEDHWFLLFNILRCPNGIGSWAASFLQVPCATEETLNRSINSPTGTRPIELPLAINSAEINHCVAVIQILLLPIKKRSDFLKAFTQFPKDISDPVKEERWIFVDSDGEDSYTSSGDCVGLKESDLIALLNQIPFEKLFVSALGIEKFLNDYIIEADLISAHQMLKVIAFFSKLIDIFGEGMLTYNTERYKQFAKRLGRLIRHTLQYVSDYHDLFIRNNLSKDPFICDRIVIELNALVIKACSFIYRTRNLATWQYFSALPFNKMDKSTIWQIFYYLNVGFPTQFPIPHEDYLEKINASDFWTKFNVANADSSSEDLYYLLQAFFEMANDRDKVKDWELIKTICLHILNMGFINEKVRDVCYKAARDILENLTIVYEDLLSYLLVQLKIRFNEIENAAFLFKSLPLENWKPELDSFEILSNWLLNFEFCTQENAVARLIISHLNWGFDCADIRRLYLPHNIHVRMACLITEASAKHAPEVVGSGSISESVRQVTTFLDYTQSAKDQFNKWCWKMINMLHLHLMDQSTDSIKKTLENPAEPLLFIPDLERIDGIYQGVIEQRPMALYVSVLVSLWGHSIPLICQKGFEQLKGLLNDYRYDTVIRCLELIVPLFLEIPETLASCESFQAILVNLFNADKTYMKMAHEIICESFIGPTTAHLDNMIHQQIINYADFGQSTPLNLINIWLNCLTSVPNWQQTNAVHLLNKILRIAYQFPDARSQAIEFFRHYYKNCEQWKGLNKTSAIKGFFGASVNRIPTLAPSSSWLALVLLEIEYKAQDSHIWPEFLRQLVASKGKMNLETVLKKTTSVMNVPSFSAQMLVIYKYANLLSTMDASNPLLPIIAQKFFELFLARVPLHYDEPSFEDSHGVSDKFYEFNVPLMKRIKANLNNAEIFYGKEATKNSDDEALSYFCRSCAKIMNTFQLWLEETAINKFLPDQINLPPQYNVKKLNEILKGNTLHWTEYLYLPHIRAEQRDQASIWASQNFRSNTVQLLRNSLPPKPTTASIQRIKNNLSSYDSIEKAPKFVKAPEHIPQGSTVKLLKDKMRILSNTASKLDLQICELNSVNCNYLDIVVGLYRMVPYEVVKIKGCTSMMFNSECSGPARINTIVENKRVNDEVQRKIDAYHERHDQLLDGLLKLNVDEFAQCIELLNGMIRTLTNLQRAHSNSSEDVSKTGIKCFYSIVDFMTDVMMKFSPINNFCSQTIAELGVFIQENQDTEGLQILQLVLKRPDLLKVLTGVFVPYRTQPQNFIKMYNFVIDSHLKRCDPKIIFVLLSKFDIVSWLEAFHPKLYDINQLLTLILRGLECWSQTDSYLLQDIFRRHLVHIFEYEFPEHYGEVMQMVLDRISDKKLMPIVLLDLLNALFAQFSCELITIEHSLDQIKLVATDFARRQNLFNLKAATDTVTLLARHFQKERLHHGLHGLYPKHVDYCQPLCSWFICFGHVVVATAICTYQELLADQICDCIFGSIVEMYSPWLICYTDKSIEQPAANWIRQLTENGKILLPWSETHVKSSKLMIQSFINTLMFVLENLPVANTILSHVFGWYIHHFAVTNIESYIRSPIHEGIAQLPWELFRPGPNYIAMFYESLQTFIPESHAMLGHIFIRINWNAWTYEDLPTWSPVVQATVVSRLLTIFVKVAFEPNIHIHTNTSKILEDAINYPWYMVDYAEIEKLLKWFVSSIESSIVLKLPTDTNYTDRAVLDLLRLSTGMMPERGVAGLIKHDTAKRILYTRVWVRMLRLCVAKNQKLLGTKDGCIAYNTAFTELLNTLSKCIRAMRESNKTIEDQRRESLNLIIEILTPMQTQSEETSNLHIDNMIKWQAQCTAGDLLCCATLYAIGHMKGFIASIYALLEATIGHYFKESTETKNWHNPTWASLLQILSMSLDKLELMPIMRGPYFFTLHIFIMYKMEKLPTLDEQIKFLQDISQLAESLKTSEHTEPHIAVVWGVIISRCSKILTVMEGAKKPLLMLGRQLQALSTKPEGWGEGLLGAIGFKRDSVTNKRKVLTRCLSCIIFSLFPITSTQPMQPNQEYVLSMQELTNLLANKKFQNIKPSIVRAIGILNENKGVELPAIPHLICRLIAIFYDQSFLTTIPEVWDFNFKMS